MNKKKPDISVIVSTYNRPDALRLVLFALNEQDTGDFEVIVADDGSSEETKEVIDAVKLRVHYNLSRVWQEHNDFRAAMIRNKGVAKSQGKYLIFLDGDTIPSPSFIRRHKQLAEDRYFVSGNRVLLSKKFTEQISGGCISIQRWSIWRWLYAFCCRKINRFLPLIFLGDLPWRYGLGTKWEGVKTCNLGVWRKDFFAVNGFDERYFGWGYEDSDLVIRLIRHGVLRKDGRCAILVFHLWHLKNSRNRERDNYKLLEETIVSSHVRVEGGIEQILI